MRVTQLHCVPCSLCSVQESSLVFLTRSQMSCIFLFEVDTSNKWKWNENSHVLPGPGSKYFDNIQVTVCFLLSKVTNRPYQALIVGKGGSLDSFCSFKPTAKYVSEKCLRNFLIIVQRGSFQVCQTKASPSQKVLQYLLLQVCTGTHPPLPQELRPSLVCLCILSVTSMGLLSLLLYLPARRKCRKFCGLKPDLCIHSYTQLVMCSLPMLLSPFVVAIQFPASRPAITATLV